MLLSHLLLFATDPHQNDSGKKEGWGSFVTSFFRSNPEQSTNSFEERRREEEKQARLEHTAKERAKSEDFVARFSQAQEKRKAEIPGLSGNRSEPSRSDHNTDRQVGWFSSFFAQQSGTTRQDVASISNFKKADDPSTKQFRESMGTMDEQTMKHRTEKPDNPNDPHWRRQGLANGTTSQSEYEKFKGGTK